LILAASQRLDGRVFLLQCGIDPAKAILPHDSSKTAENRG
jgi:hypothetical protein